MIIRGSCDYSGWATVQKLSEFTGECNNSNDCSGSSFIGHRSHQCIANFGIVRTASTKHFTVQKM